MKEMKVTFDAVFRLHLQTLFNALAFLFFLSDTPMSLSIALIGNADITAPLRANLVMVLLVLGFVLELISLFYYLWIIIRLQHSASFEQAVNRYQLVAILSLVLLFMSMVMLNVVPDALFV